MIEKKKTSEIRLTLIGASGRMGCMIGSCVDEWEGIHLVGAIEAEGSEFVGRSYTDLIGDFSHRGNTSKITIRSDLKQVVADTDVIIDFSSPKATLHGLAAVKDFSLSYLTGTTGFSSEEEKQLEFFSKEIAFFKASNFSLGIHYMTGLSGYLSKRLRMAEIEIVERHHNQKKDAPSGTAKTLLKACAKGRDWDAEKVSMMDRSLRHEKRSPDEIGVHALRAGNIIGEHTVSFTTPHEEVILSHKAHHRRVFVDTLPEVIRWMHKKRPGRIYGMNDVFPITQMMLP